MRYAHSKVVDLIHGVLNPNLVYDGDQCLASAGQIVIREMTMDNTLTRLIMHPMSVTVHISRVCAIGLQILIGSIPLL